jgi:hypothetical protein
MLASGRSDAHLRGARIDAAGLVLAADLVYVDGVGTGLTQQSSMKLRELMEEIPTKAPLPFEDLKFMTRCDSKLR